jgi:hypothetical protein
MIDWRSWFYLIKFFLGWLTRRFSDFQCSLGIPTRTRFSNHNLEVNWNKNDRHSFWYIFLHSSSHKIQRCLSFLPSPPIGSKLLTGQPMGLGNTSCIGGSMLVWKLNRKYVKRQIHTQNVIGFFPTFSHHGVSINTCNRQRSKKSIERCFRHHLWFQAPRVVSGRSFSTFQYTTSQVKFICFPWYSDGWYYSVLLVPDMTSGTHDFTTFSHTRNHFRSLLIVSRLSSCLIFVDWLWVEGIALRCRESEVSVVGTKY